MTREPQGNLSVRCSNSTRKQHWNKYSSVIQSWNPPPLPGYTVYRLASTYEALNMTTHCMNPSITNLCIFLCIRTALMFAVRSLPEIQLQRYSTRSPTMMKAFQITELVHPSKVNVWVVLFRRFCISRQDEEGIDMDCVVMIT